MIKKITEIFTEEEIVKSILRSGDETKVASLIADEEFIKKYISLLLENEIAIDKICEAIEKITSPEVLHIIASGVIKVEGDIDPLYKVLNNPHCSVETIMFVEEAFDRFWTDMCNSLKIDKKAYPKEKLMSIAEADKNGICGIGIILFPACDEELLYKILENSKDEEADKYGYSEYSNMCGLALMRNYSLREDILEKCLESFLGCYGQDKSDIEYIVTSCDEVYLERVMAKIEENASEEICKEARAAYAERKKGSK